MLVRAACHVHSNWSYDGKWSLKELANLFAKRGYRVVMITEHDQGFDELRRQRHREACAMASSREILLVPGLEYSDASNTIHLLVWGDIPFIGSGAEPERILTAAQQGQGATVFAHPSRREAWKLFKPEWKGRLLGVEIWNRKTDGWAPSKEAWPLLQQTEALPFVGLDFHDTRQFFPLATILEVTPPVSETSVLASLSSRLCWSKAFGLSLNPFTQGAVAKALHGAEFIRRRAARIYRRLSMSKVTLASTSH